MMFPRACVGARPLLGMLSATALAAACIGVPSAAADDDPPPPPLHNVHYTVWAEQPFNVAIYYRDTDPPNWADYSHDPYQFSPKVDAASARISSGTSTLDWRTPMSGRWWSRAPAGSQRRAPTFIVRSPSTVWL